MRRPKVPESFVSFACCMCASLLLLLYEAMVVIWIVIWIMYFQYIVVGK